MRLVGVAGWTSHAHWGRHHLRRRPWTRAPVGGVFAARPVRPLWPRRRVLAQRFGSQRNMERPEVMSAKESRQEGLLLLGCTAVGAEGGMLGEELCCDLTSPAAAGDYLRACRRPLRQNVDAGERAWPRLVTELATGVVSTLLAGTERLSGVNGCPGTGGRRSYLISLARPL